MAVRDESDQTAATLSEWMFSMPFDEKIDLYLSSHRSGRDHDSS
jgi:hypothetical protein